MRKIPGIITLILIVIMAGEALAGDKVAILNVQARVIPVVKQTILHSESSLSITQADIERGYIEVQKGMVLSVKTNAINGYVMEFFTSNNLFNKVAVSDGDNTYALAGSGGEVHMPYEGLNPVTKELSFRFYLSSDIKPGIYPWPVALMISAM